MNEDTARTKFCPFMRYKDGNIIITKTSEPDSYLKCIASDCMLWISQERRIIQNDDGRNEFEYFGGHCGAINK